MKNMSFNKLKFYNKFIVKDFAFHYLFKNVAMLFFFFFNLAINLNVFLCFLCFFSIIVVEQTECFILSEQIKILIIRVKILKNSSFSLF